jgi:hypothetical protein
MTVVTTIDCTSDATESSHRDAPAPRGYLPARGFCKTLESRRRKGSGDAGNRGHLEEHFDDSVRRLDSRCRPERSAGVTHLNLGKTPGQRGAQNAARAGDRYIPARYRGGIGKTAFEHGFARCYVEKEDNYGCAGDAGDSHEE